MTPRPQENGTSTDNNNNDTSPTPSKFPKDWLLSLVKRHSAQNTRNTPPDLKDKKILAVAPMVDQSDLPFRLLCRNYGANVAFTPMIHCKLFCTRPIYQKKFFNLAKGTPPQDRPLIAQLCGSDTEYVVETALLLQEHVDGIDLNCGCPQSIARRGNYGAFLLEQPHVLVPLVKRLVSTLEIPVSVKVRIVPTPDGTHDIPASMALYQSLVNEGASMITIHGRSRFQKGPLTGRADWNLIRKTVQAFPTIPILANGSMSNLDEIRACLDYTQAAGVMCSEALLEYPPIYMESLSSSTNKRIGPGRCQLAKEYLALAQQYPPQEGGQGSGQKCLKAHLHRFLHAEMQRYTEIRDGVAYAKSIQDLHSVVVKLEKLYQENGHEVGEEELSWYVRHRTSVEKEQERKEKAIKESAGVDKDAMDQDAAECNTCFFGTTGDDDDGDY